MDSELTRPAEPDESQSSRLSSVHASDMEIGSGNDSDNDSSNGGSSEAAPQVEWLATGRQRRSTAGNRMKSMLANEEPDSDLELLFAEDENDQGFSDAGDHASDVQMDSSSSDDDDNDDDELEGEKELDRQAKERRTAQRKRKAQEAIPAKFRKKVRIDTSASTPRSSVAPSTPQTMSHQPPPRKKKKSERASWLPSVADMPTRASSRQTTRLSKEQLHAQMEAREAKRLKQLAQMQKKAARLEALKKPPMTQADRLREAALVEERNARSLNRWEEAERQREEERRAKLAALQERTLRGPVLTFWSGAGRFGDGWRKGEGVNVAVEEKPKKAKRERPVKGKKKDDAKETVKEEIVAGTKSAVPEDATMTRPQPTGDGKVVEVGQTGEAKTSEASKQDTAADGASKDVVMTDAPAAGQTQEPPKSTTLATTTTATTATATNGGAESKSTHNTINKAVGDVLMTAAPTASTEKTTDDGVERQNGNEESKTLDQKPSLETQPHETFEAPLREPKELTSPTQPKEEISGAKDPGAHGAHAPAITEASEGTAPLESATKDAQSQPGSIPELANGSHATASSNAPPTTEGSLPPKTAPTQPLESGSLPASKIVSRVQSEAATPQPEQARSPLDGLATTREAIIYQNFDQNAIKDRGVQTQVLFGHKMSRLPKPSPAPICPITYNPARYRDPNTNLPFHSAAAFKELQRLQSGEYRWSRLLGAWAGSGLYAARGVPERFLNPARCPTLEEVQRIERKREEKEKFKLQQAEAEKRAKEEKKAAVSTKPAASVGVGAGTGTPDGGGGGGGGGGGATATEDEKPTISVKTEAVAGARTEASSGVHVTM